MTMFRTTILSLVLLQTSQSLSLGRINPAGQDASGSDYPPILTEESFGMNLARHQTPEYSDEVTQKSRDAQFMASSFVFSDSGQGSFQSRGASMTLDDSHCPADRPCTAADVEYRSVDGACNNLLNPHWGRAGLPFRRLLPRKHSLIGCGAASNQLPNPRLLSRLLVHRGDFDIHHEISMVTMVWGQVIDHDIEITPPRKTSEGDFLDCCAPENLSASDCCSILAPENDPFYGRGGRPLCMPFLR